MAYTSITTADIAVDKFFTNALATKIKDDIDYLYGASGGITNIMNGSFEIDSDSDGVPDNWEINLYHGGSSALVNGIDGIHGYQCIAFTHPGGSGNGGGYISTDYLEASPDIPLLVSGMRWCTVASGVRNIIRIRWYDKDKVFLNNIDLEDASTGFLTTPTWWSYIIPNTNDVIPYNARYLKLRLIGGYTSLSAAGTTYFDDFSIRPAINLAETAPVIAAATYYASNAGAVRTASYTSWTKYMEYQISCKGSLRISFGLQVVGGGIAYARIYHNGSAVGISRATSSSARVTYSEDIAGWNVGDLLQIYAYTSSAIYDVTVDCLVVKCNKVVAPFIDRIDGQIFP